MGKDKKLRTIFFNGEFLQRSDAFIHSYAPGVFHARGAFETILTDNDNILDLDAHLARLKYGLELLKIPFPSKTKTIAKEVVKRNSYITGRLRISVWKEKKETHLMVVCIPYQRPSLQKYRNGFRVGIYPKRITRPKNQAQIKSLNYAPFYKAFLWAQENGFDEALLVNGRGEISEGSRSNIFFIKDRVLYTPCLRSGCLNGITRQKFLKSAKRHKIAVKEIAVSKKNFMGAQEIFLTNSLIGVIRANLSRT